MSGSGWFEYRDGGDIHLGAVRHYAGLRSTGPERNFENRKGKGVPAIP